MAERYEEILSLDKNLWTYGSPILFESGILQLDTVSDKRLLTLTFRNISSRTIKSVSVVITAFAGDDEVEQKEHEYLALNLASEEAAGMNARLPIDNQEADKFTIHIRKVKFKDGEEWEKDAVLESMAVIDDPVRFGQEKEDEYEKNYAEACEYAQKDTTSDIKKSLVILKDMQWYKDSEEVLISAAKKYKIARRTEERKKKEKNRKAERQKKVKKTFYIIAALAIVAVIGVAITVVTTVIPNNQYSKAKEYCKDGQYEKAIDICNDLNGYKDSENTLEECYYYLAFNAFGKEDYKATIEYLKNCDSDYKGAKNLLAKSNYRLGVQVIEKEDYDEALKLFTDCLKYTEDKNDINSANAGIAQAHYKKGDFAKAWELISNLYKNDKSVKNAYNEYGYAYALQIEKSGDAGKALDIYKATKGYKDSTKKYAEAIYKQAVKAGESGDFKKAMELLKGVQEDLATAKTLYNDIKDYTTSYSVWVGTWRAKNEKEKTIKISTVLHKGKMCFKINDNYMDYDEIISRDNNVRGIVVGSYQIKFKLKDYNDEKYTFSREGKKMVRVLRYEGKDYKRTYKKK